MSTNDKKEDLFNPIQGLNDVLSASTKIKTISGKDLEIPVASWRMELQVVKSVAELLGEVKEDLNLTWEDIVNLQNVSDDKKGSKASIQKEKLLNLVLKVAEAAPAKITDIVAVIINKDASFVEENLDLGVILQILLPFFVQRMNRLIELMNHMDVDFESATQKMRAKLHETAGKKPR